MMERRPALAFYTRWLYSLAKSPAARRMVLMRLYELENEDQAERDNRPSRLVYVTERAEETEVRIVDLPGVEIVADREFEEVDASGRRPVCDHSRRTWTETDEAGQEVPVGTEHIIGWARERVARAWHDDRTLTIAGTVGIVVPAVASALLGEPQLALVQARAGAVALGVVQVARWWRGG